MCCGFHHNSFKNGNFPVMIAEGKLQTRKSTTIRIAMSLYGEFNFFESMSQIIVLKCKKKLQFANSLQMLFTLETLSASTLTFAIANSAWSPSKIRDFNITTRESLYLCGMQNRSHDTTRALVSLYLVFNSIFVTVICLAHRLDLAQCQHG